MEARISPLAVPQGIHYEGMHHDIERNRLLWVDILGKALCLYEMDNGRFSRYDMPCMIGFAFPKSKSEFLCGLASGLALFNTETKALKSLGDPEPLYPNNRLNDGKLDPLGRVWANTMDIDAKAPTGHFYRCTLNNTASANYHAVDSGFTIGNGPTWSPDGKTIYHAETCRGRIFAFDFDLEAGTINNKQLFYQHEEGAVLPDGMQTDFGGNLWVAMAHGSKIIKLSPQGKLIDEILLPTRFPTSLAFGDETERCIYITTSQLDDIKGDDLAGSILKASF